MSIDFRFRDFFHPFLIYDLHRTLDRTQWLPAGELRDFQARRLSGVIEYACSKVPYYRRLFSRLRLTPNDITRVEDLCKLPTLTKEQVRNNQRALRSTDLSHLHPIPCTTSGTTGEPVTIYLDKHANALEFAYYWRHWGWAGYRLGMKFAELSSHYFLLRPGLAEREYVYQPHLRRLVLNGNLISAERGRRLTEGIRRHKPQFLKGMSSALYFLALSLKQAGAGDLAFQAVFSTGEVLTPLHRSLIEKVFHAPVLDSYGQMERTVAICQCLEGTYHINSDYGILELLPDTVSERDGRRLGQAVGTGLYNLAMPLIRYEIGDEIELCDRPEECPCGRKLPAVTGIHGRSEDVIETPDGRLLTTLFIIPEFVEGARFVQFVHVKQDCLELRIVPGRSWDGEKEQELLQYCRRMVGPAMTVAPKIVSSADLIRDASGKTRAVVGKKWA